MSHNEDGKKEEQREQKNGLSRTTAARQPYPYLPVWMPLVGAIYPPVFIGFFHYSVAQALPQPSTESFSSSVQ